MKKSKAISLVLITAALASCNKDTKKDDWSSNQGGKTYVRGDSTAPYTRTHHFGTGLLWFYAFRPMFGYSNGVFGRSGFYSGAISERGNFGSNTSKGRSVRGGFGRGGSSRVSS
jgi:hypothetical protein